MILFYKMADHEEDTACNNDYNPEEEVVEGNWKLVDLPVINVDNGETDEEEMFQARAKIYRFDDKQWKERGVGSFRILKNKVSGRYSAILRQDQVLKFRCHFWITGKGLCQLEKLPTAEKSLFWNCMDFSEEELKFEKFCLRLKTEEEIEKMKDVFNKAYEENSKLNWNFSPEKNENTKSEITLKEEDDRLLETEKKSE